MAIRVLVVDDSALMRRVLTDLLAEDPEIEVVGSAPDPYVAREKIKQLNPDVLTLDVEMPRMDGLTFLENLMRLRPMPVVMVSSLTEVGADVTLEALSMGAVDFVTKPRADLVDGLHQLAAELRAKVRMAAKARLRGSRQERAPRRRMQRHAQGKLIAIGASTGGTEAIKEVLEALPADAPPVLIVQHIPALFSRPFAERMNRHCPMNVCEAADGQQVLPGHVYIAPGDRHLELRRSGGHMICRLLNSDPVNRHRPSVDVLFHSVVEELGSEVAAAILTGMGDDGARGLLALRQAGAVTIAQDEASSIVWGMPGSAVRMGAAQKILPLDRVADALLAGAYALDEA